MWGGWGEHVATMSNLNPSYLELSQVELGLGFDKNSYIIYDYCLLLHNNNFANTTSLATSLEVLDEKYFT